ncbi:unnamed protein product [Pneumocystis jirovecii]|uniref:Ubiquitin-like domain-containing protein n=2 Tax=Pneumocystis jirovecii TaxID=42068 RepID=L0PDE6_PNEJI|nr:uncharacterized protein T551_03616 [Pneumocystis jirovecii RU7]KTW26044.1 hypothetical protein T551_03616 [Pneumocystis jirovecii RU7]CCJ30124.1 unnamed protein product [Pneumocystis jirovecii]
MDSTGGPGPSFTKIQLIIRFSNGDEDIWLSIDKESTVRELKARLRELRPEVLSSRGIRLVYLGKILRNDAVLLEALKRRPSGRPEVLLHCSINDEMEVDADEERNIQHDLNITPLPLGFNRLREVGFSEREIALLREQFLLIHGRDSQNTDPNVASELEEEWINQTALENIGQEEEGAYEDIIIGASIGFLGGIIVLFFIWEPKIFSRRRQMAIIAGIMINLFFGFLRL